jgi:hypothetical protein
MRAWNLTLITNMQMELHALRRMIAAGIAAGLLFTAGVAAPALGAEPDSPSEWVAGTPLDGWEAPTDPAVVYPSAAPLRAEQTETMTGGISPAGCYGQTDMAHPSDFVYASVHGRTYCSIAPVLELGVTTTLQKLGWLYWENILSDSNMNQYSRTSNDAHPHWQCSGWGSQAYRGSSFHYSAEPSGTYTSNTTGLERRFSC